MDYNTLKIRLNQQLQVGSTFNISIKDVATSIITNFTFTFVALRTQPFEVTLPPPTAIVGESEIIALAATLTHDMSDFTGSTYSNIMDVFYNYPPSEPVYVFPAELVSFDFSAGVPADFDVIDPSLPSEGIVISGLNADNYLINNEIWIDISGVTISDFITIKLKNLSNQKETLAHKLYLLNGKTSFNLQPLIKSIFDKIGGNNINKFSIIYGISFTKIAVDKFFIRGGNRTEKTNQFLAPNAILRNSYSLPYWIGYETVEYILNASSEIEEVGIDSVFAKDLRREKSCNSLYLRFLNQKGGYSNWLFETYKIDQDNKPLGAYYSGQNSVDLGSEVDFGLQVYSKVPKEYVGLIKDLFVSPEVYYLDQKRWIRIYNSKNSIDEDLNKKTYSVQGKFDIINRFNPSVLWSN